MKREEGLQIGLGTVEETAEVERHRARQGEEDDDEDEVEGSGSSYPNLKYAKPKYKNVESVLKYVESDEDRGGLKLVIMNFND